MAKKDRPVVATSEDAPIAWGAIAESLILISADAARVPGAAAAIKIIKALVGSGEAQAAMLKQIGSDVELIRTGPFHAAREHMEIAVRKAQAGTDYQHHLQEADDLLVQALAHCKSVEEASVVKFNLGVIAAIRGDRVEAGYRLKQAYEDAATVTRELGDRAANVRVIGGSKTVRRLAIAGGVLYYPIGAPIGVVLAVRKYSKVKKSKHATAVLQSYVPFASTVARAHNVIDSAEIFPAPQLSGSGGSFDLKWAEPGR
jgi:hypothetical protein